MSLLPNLRYNIQSHGWDYNIGTNGSTLVAASSPQYTWQISSCTSNSSSPVYIADTASHMCLWGSETAMGMRPCRSADRVWRVNGSEATNTWTIQIAGLGDGVNGSLFLDEKTFGMGVYGADGSRSDYEWAFRSGEIQANGTWDVCEYVVIESFGT